RLWASKGRLASGDPPISDVVAVPNRHGDLLPISIANNVLANRNAISDGPTRGVEKVQGSTTKTERDAADHLGVREANAGGSTGELNQAPDVETDAVERLQAAGEPGEVVLLPRGIFP